MSTDTATPDPNSHEPAALPTPEHPQKLIEGMHPEPAPPPTPAEPPKKKRSKHNWIIWVIVLGAFALGGYFLTKMTATPQRSSNKNARDGSGRPVPVTAATVKQGNANVTVSALGAVTPVYTVNVTSRVVGELTQVLYKEGQMVKKGDVLAVIDPRPYVAAQIQAEGQLARDQALLKNASIDLDRYQKAYAQHAIPEQQFATQQATVNQDEGTVKLDEGNLDAAKVNVDYTKIKSPIDGRVGLRAVDPGNIVQANGTASLLTITQLQPITVIFSIAEDYLAEVVKAMLSKHSLRVDALDREDQHEIAQGTLLTIDNQVNTTTGTVRLRATFNNRDNKLFPNQFVNATLYVRNLRDVNLIPTAAVQRNGDEAFVYVIQQDGEVQERPITIATTEGEQDAVTGVKPGEVVVTDGFDKLRNGIKVRVRQSKPASGVAKPKYSPLGNNPQQGNTQPHPQPQRQSNVQGPQTQQGTAEQQVGNHK